MMKTSFKSWIVCTAGFVLMLLAGPGISATSCVPIGRWALVEPSGAHTVSDADLFARLARESVVLLGERHDNPDDHRWQLQTLSALHTSHPDMVLAFEMFPRKDQPLLDRWVAGELGETEFLAAVDWQKLWNVDAQFYLPLFHYARMNRIPMQALNVDQALVREIRLKGFDGVPADKREGISRPAAAAGPYLDFLFTAYAEHQRASDKPKAGRHDPDFQHFVEAQQFWDRAMAQGIAAARSRNPAALVVGIMGKGHVERGFGVPSQLANLGVGKVASLLPWEAAGDCSDMVPGYAYAVFGMAPPAHSPEVQKPRLGVQVEDVAEGVRIIKVTKGSVADVAGMRDGDVVAEAAGIAVRQYPDLITVVQRQAHGTWLPLKIKRHGESLDLVAKFPPLAP